MERMPGFYRLPVQVNRENNMRYISKEMINDEGIVDFSVLSWRNVTVTEKIIVQGDIRSHRGVRLCEDSVVCGNIFAEGDVLLEKIRLCWAIFFLREAFGWRKGRPSDREVRSAR